MVVASAARLQEAAAEGHCLPPSGEEPASLQFLSDWGADTVAQVRWAASWPPRGWQLGGWAAGPCSRQGADQPRRC